MFNTCVFSFMPLTHFSLIHTRWHKPLSTFIFWPETLKQSVEIRNKWFMDLLLCLLNMKYGSPFINISGIVNHEFHGHQLEEGRRCSLSYNIKNNSSKHITIADFICNLFSINICDEVIHRMQIAPKFVRAF